MGDSMDGDGGSDVGVEAEASGAGGECICLCYVSYMCIEKQHENRREYKILVFQSRGHYSYVFKS